MKKFLAAKQVPYLVTILMALLGYQLNNLVNEFKDSPIVEYEFQIDEETIVRDSLIVRNQRCVLTNISKRSSFKNLTIFFLYDLHVPSEIYEPDFIVINPSSVEGISTDAAQNMTVSYSIHHIQPEQKYMLLFKTKGHKEATKHPKLYLSTSETVRLVEKSLMTTIVKNYILLNLILSGLWLGFIIIYIINYSKQLENEETNNTNNNSHSEP